MLKIRQNTKCYHRTRLNKQATHGRQQKLNKTETEAPELNITLCNNKNNITQYNIEWHWQS